MGDNRWEIKIFSSIFYRSENYDAMDYFFSINLVSLISHYGFIATARAVKTFSIPQTIDFTAFCWIPDSLAPNP
ncbi:MAG TPA: hypothetical protein DDW56_03490 [Cyanobacteria bacterium UBA11366]|nr:hypothetical protein [Cyanobacteria bacterium UBA11366]